MIGRLRGHVVEARPDRVVLDVGGVGYDLHVSVGTYGELARLDDGAEAVVFVHTHVRDDALSLFGFATRHERALFLLLVGVAGIGPKLAQNILSGSPGPDLADAIARGDAKRLQAIPGVGKKTSERMVLELRDKIRDLEPEAGAPTLPASAETDDLVTALVNLGYREAQAEKAVAQAGSEGEFAERLRRALRELSPR